MLFQTHFQLVVRKRFHIFFFIFPRNIRRKSVPFSYSFFSPLHPRTQGALHNSYTQSRPRCTGNSTLAKTFLQRRTIFPRWTISLSRPSGEVYTLTLQSNQTVYIYIVQFIAIKVRSTVCFTIVFHYYTM